jgi:hypothetical protein
MEPGDGACVECSEGRTCGENCPCGCVSRQGAVDSPHALRHQPDDVAGPLVQWAALGLGIAWVMSLFRVIRAIILAGGLAALGAYLLKTRQ